MENSINNQKSNATRQKWSSKKYTINPWGPEMLSTSIFLDDLDSCSWKKDTYKNNKQTCQQIDKKEKLVRKEMKTLINRSMHTYTNKAKRING